MTLILAILIGLCWFAWLVGSAYVFASAMAEPAPGSYVGSAQWAWCWIRRGWLIPLSALSFFGCWAAMVLLLTAISR